jgi:FAD/FMN-containing dehydrogenase
LVKMMQPMPYVAVQQLIDPGNPWGISEYFKVDYLEELPDEAIDAAVAKADEIGSPFTQLIFAPLGGALERVDRSSMALGLPQAKWLYFCLAMWWGRDDAERETQWAREFMKVMSEWAVDAAPANFISSDDTEGRLRVSYGDEKYERLVALKDKYDPQNVFALNQNIPPSMPPA